MAAVQFLYSVELNVCSWHGLAFGEARSGQLIHKEVLLERAAAPSFMSAAQALAATAVAAPLWRGTLGHPAADDDAGRGRRVLHCTAAALVKELPPARRSIHDLRGVGE